MKKIILIVACVAMALVFSLPSYAVEPEIRITSAYTCNDMNEACTEFQAWETVYYNIEFSVYGNPDRLYKVVGMTHAFGVRTEEIQKLYPGDYTIVFGRLFGDDVDPGTYVGTHKLKLKKRRNLLDVATTVTEVSVVE